jgi:hypothetical protein
MVVVAVLIAGFCTVIVVMEFAGGVSTSGHPRFKHSKNRNPQNLLMKAREYEGKLVAKSESFVVCEKRACMCVCVCVFVCEVESLPVVALRVLCRNIISRASSTVYATQPPHTYSCAGRAARSCSQGQKCFD